MDFRVFFRSNFHMEGLFLIVKVPGARLFFSWGARLIFYGRGGGNQVYFWVSGRGTRFL